MALFDHMLLPALHQACRDGDSCALRALMIHDVSDRLELFHRLCECDSYLGWTPAHWASYHGKVDCFRHLLDCGLNVDITEGRYKRTPAHIAAFAGHPHMLLLLLRAGADPNKQDDNGDTVVHHAARSGSNDCLSILHSHNAYMCLINKEGQTPLDVANMSGFQHCVEYLTQFHSHFYPGKRKLKRSLDEDEINKEVKKLCNGSTWKTGTNGTVVNHKTEILDNFRRAKENEKHLESVTNGHMDHDMEVQCEDSRPMPVPRGLCSNSPSKLSFPQRCMGSHYM